MIITDFDAFHWLCDIFNPRTKFTKYDTNSYGWSVVDIKQRDKQRRIDKGKCYKPKQKTIEFLTDDEVKRFKVAKLLSKHPNLIPYNFNINSFKNKPLPKHVCDYFIKYFTEKGVIK